MLSLDMIKCIYNPDFSFYLLSCHSDTFMNSDAMDLDFVPGISKSILLLDFHEVGGITPTIMDEKILRFKE